MSGTALEHVSELPFAQTVSRVMAAIEAAGLKVFAAIDHAAAAREIGVQMPPTLVLLYGSARGGTPLMLAAPNVGLELPLRVLIREDGDNTIVVFNRVADLARLPGISDALVSRLEPAQRLLVDAIRS